MTMVKVGGQKVLIKENSFFSLAAYIPLFISQWQDSDIIKRWLPKGVAYNKLIPAYLPEKKFILISCRSLKI